MKQRRFMHGVSFFVCLIFCATQTAFGAPSTTLSQTLSAKQPEMLSPQEITQARDPNDIAVLLQSIVSSGKPVVTDLSLEAFIPELHGDAQLSLGAGGLGFLTGETWGGYAEFMKKFTGVGFMPLYAEHEGKKIDWDNEPGINTVMTRDENGHLKPFTIQVPLNGGVYETTVRWVNRKGAVVFLFEQPEMFRILYPGRWGAQWEQDRQYGFFPQCFTTFMQTVGMKPSVVRLSEPQLVFAAASMENSVKRDPESVFKGSRIVMTTHTPEAAALPTWEGDRYGKLVELIGWDLVDPVTNKAGGKWYIDAANALAERAYIVNAVSEEHGDVTKQVILPDYAWKTVAIQNASDPDLWYGPTLADRVKEVGVENVSGEDLFRFNQERKEILNDLLEQETDARFADMSRPTFGLIRRLVEYKAQGMLIPMLEWITGDTDQEFELYGERKKGLGANILIGGKGSDGVGKDWARIFRDLMKRPELQGKFIFLEKTGTEAMQYATQACDAWVAIPWLTREASGTSDERAALNGNLVIATATGGPLAYIKHRKNGWLINPFRRWDFREIVSRFQGKDAGIIDKFYRTGSAQVEDAFQEVSKLYYDYVNNGNTRLIEMKKDIFMAAHREVSTQAMIPKYERLFEAAYDGSGAIGFAEKMKSYRAPSFKENTFLLAAA